MPMIFEGRRGPAGDHRQRCCRPVSSADNRPSAHDPGGKIGPLAPGVHLLALTSTRVLVQGVIWDSNSVDQWGVELGEQEAGQHILAGNRAPTARDARQRV